MIAPDVILLSDPARGVDVGTKQDIYYGAIIVGMLLVYGRGGRVTS